MKTNNIYLPDIVGKGYKTFWNFKGRYRVVKGSRASKKSTTTAINLIYRIMKYPKSNALVVRKTYRTLQDSCYAQLRWACDRLGVKEYFDFKLSPLEIIYKPSGQKILFRGLDDPLKVTSVTVDVGYLCFLWIEEAYEIMSESDFDMLDESIRGEVPGELFKQITLTLNPWNERHWIKGRFFDREDKDTLAITTNYLCNEWLDESDRSVFERMKINNPRRFQVAGLGNWGIAEGLVYENFIEKSFTLNDVKDFVTVAGLDFGYTNDPTAFFIGFLDDFIKIKLKRSLGLKAYQKIILQVALSFYVAFYQYTSSSSASQLMIPFTDFVINVGILYIPIMMFIIVAIVNAVNLTDGLDGLASGVTLIVSVFFMLFASSIAGNTEVAVLAAATVGACLGFLGFNSYPARVFMGDTGSMALGGAVVAFSVLTNSVLIIPIIGGIYFAEALSVLIQVGYFKATRKRFFKMAPIHHHFEQCGWPETRVVFIFWIITVVLAWISIIAVF